jgi:inner membrane protein
VDNLTHTLAGIAISQAGLNRKTRFATLTLILAANAPDIDIVMGFKGSLAYLKYHRGITHSLPGICGLAVLIWALVSWIGKKTSSKSNLIINDQWLLLAAFLGTASHLLLDFTNGYGVRPFLPFSGRWYAWSIVPIIDPVQLAILIAGLSIPWLLGLVSEEVGARRPRGRAGALFCLCGMACLWAVRDVSHRRALSILDSHTYSGENPGRFAALPQTMNPFAWIGVVDTETSIQVVHVNSLNAGSAPETLGDFEKPQMSPPLRAAMETEGGKVFLDFARFPWAQVDENDQGYNVSLTDLRFNHGSTQSLGFTLEIELDKDLRSQSETFYFTSPREPDKD